MLRASVVPPHKQGYLEQVEVSVGEPGFVSSSDSKVSPIDRIVSLLSVAQFLVVTISVPEVGVLGSKAGEAYITMEQDVRSKGRALKQP